MEFMMTYGWAILAVVIAIAALGYFGVLSPDKFLGEKCITTPPFSCSEFKANSTGITLLIYNRAGKELATAQLDIAGCGTSLSADVPDDGVFGGYIECPVNGSRFRGPFNLSYMTADGVLNKSLDGSLTVKVE
jgi:hypothetical protein